MAAVPSHTSLISQYRATRQLSCTQVFHWCVFFHLSGTVESVGFLWYCGRKDLAGPGTLVEDIPLLFLSFRHAGNAIYVTYKIIIVSSILLGCSLLSECPVSHDPTIPLQSKFGTVHCTTALNRIVPPSCHGLLLWSSCLLPPQLS